MQHFYISNNFSDDSSSEITRQRCWHCHCCLITVTIFIYKHQWYGPSLLTWQTRLMWVNSWHISTSSLFNRRDMSSLVTATCQQNNNTTSTILCIKLITNVIMTEYCCPTCNSNQWETFAKLISNIRSLILSLSHKQVLTPWHKTSHNFPHCFVQSVFWHF